jgi:hypothetical protein
MTNTSSKSPCCATKIERAFTAEKQLDWYCCSECGNRIESAPNNMAGERWEEKVDEFLDSKINEWYNRQLAADLKVFISKTRQEAIAGEREGIYKEARYFRSNLATDQMNDEYNDFLASLQ